MSEKFVVGQWVTWRAMLYRIVFIDAAPRSLKVNSGESGSESMWVDEGECIPFVWQVGRTYRTTSDGVTATIQAKTNKELYGQDSRPDSFSEEWAWNDRTGLLRGIEKVETAPHLLPYLADEPPPVAEAATYSEFDAVDECDDVNHPSHYTQHPSGVECVDIVEHFNFNIGNAIKYLWRAGLKGDALEDLRKAAWYVQREIERRAKR